MTDHKENIHYSDKAIRARRKKNWRNGKLLEGFSYIFTDWTFTIDMNKVNSSTLRFESACTDFLVAVLTHLATLAEQSVASVLHCTVRMQRMDYCVALYIKFIISSNLMTLLVRLHMYVLLMSIRLLDSAPLLFIFLFEQLIYEKIC